MPPRAEQLSFHGAGIALCLILIFSATCASSGAQASATLIPQPAAEESTQSNRGVTQSEVGLRWDALVLRDAGATAAEREAAAGRIVSELADPSSWPIVKDSLLTISLEPRNAGAFIAAALGARDSLPVEALALITPAINAAGSNQSLTMLLGPLGAIRTRESAAVLVRYSVEGKPRQVRDAAMAALARLSGREDIGPDAAAWRAWFERSKAMSEAEWSRSIADAFATQAKRSRVDRNAVVSRVVDLYRKLHLSTQNKERSEFLAGILRDDIPEVRALGFELVGRELSAGLPQGGEIGEAAIGLLSHADTVTRTNAALLVNQLAPPGAEAPLLSALRTEQDPPATAAMLGALARYPTEHARPLIIERLGEDGELGAAAQAACLSLARAGVLRTSDRRAVLEIMRSLKPGALAPAGCHLLAMLGDETDREFLIAPLNSDSAPLRQAAAFALSPDPEMTDAIISAAANDPDLYPHAARAILLHRPTASGYFDLRALKGATPEAEREGRLLIIPAIPATDVWSIARQVTDATEIDDLLNSLVKPARVMSESVSVAKARAMLAGGLRLARLRLDAGRADDCLAAIGAVADLLPPDTTSDAHVELLSMEVAALLLLDRAELAQSLDAPCSAWLDGLRRSLGKPHARALADLIATKFRGLMTLEESEEFTDLRQKAQGS